MSNLSFIPQATASKSAPEFQHPSLSEKKNQSGISNFDHFLKNANENQFKTKPFQEKPEQNRPVVNEVKPEPKKDEIKTADQAYSEKMESKSKPNQEAANNEGTKKASQPQTQNKEEEKVAVETQSKEGQTDEALADVNQEELLVLLAHLAEAEAVIRGETQPETVQMVELAEAMADSELVEVVQETAGSVESSGANPGADTEAQMVNAVELTQISPDTGLKAANLKLNVETPVEDRSAGLEQLSQVLPQTSGNHSQTKGESLSNQGNNDSKGQVSESIKVSHNGSIEIESQAFSKVFAENTLSQKAEADVQSDGNRILAQQDQSSVKNGKVNLAVIQTQLAVNDAPEVKTETPVLNIVSSQPSISNVSQAQTPGSTGVNSTSREELFSQIVEHAKVVVNNGGSEMEVNLKPEHLGKLQLKVTIENEVVTAKFVAESQQVKEIIESNLGQLKRNLQENGMQVDAIMVSVGNHQGSESFDQAAYNREGFNNFEGNAGANNDDSVFETVEQTPVAERETVVDLIA